MGGLVRIVVILLALLLGVIAVSAAVEFYRERDITALYGAATFALPVGLLAWYLWWQLKRGRFARSGPGTGRSRSFGWPDWVWPDWAWQDFDWFWHWNLQYFIAAAALALMAFAGVQEGNAAFAITPGIMAAGLAIKGILKFFD